jgi:O-antigen/teichoic acid export membrane protein
MLIGNLANFFVLAGFSRKIIPILPRVNWREALGQVKDGVPYFLFSVFSMIYYRIDSLMLSKMSSEKVVGWYGGAFRLFDVLNFFPYILTVAMFPVLSRLWKDSDSAHKRTTQKSLELVILAGIPIAVSVHAFSSNLVQLLYGLEGYGPSVQILQLLTSGLLFLYIDMILATMLLASDKQGQFSIVSLCAIPFKIVLNLFLIRYFESANGNGGLGAAIATVFTEFCIMITALTLAPKGVLGGFRWSVVPKGLIGGGLMVVWLWMGTSFAIPWVPCALVSLVIYGTTLLLLRTLEPAELAAIGSLLTVKGLSKLKDLHR